ncbi:TIGR04013 family B12-binding domain/radical SAM domain-containing protein [Thermopolyspora flexuosa]|jgi:B12-binding domain/radical SAM domain protein|uniref:B12-binding domain/radical SAM domain protein n=1 Tax=Thermopolyspora flexuosa TaxID=103836 RepID=A0A543IU33_9ACTN|nr:TIGR04013 family B12-binding domain/radical SAM domain-containing protein [Thermopolyspora flexuosa]TQM74083.1 B12-binding domain/radical SAM domain protein [Thermopolyspora flexuosa]
MDVTVVVRYRKAVTYGVHALLAAMDTAGLDCETLLGETVEQTAAHIASAKADRVLVLWSFYSPDAEKMAEELAAVRALADGDHVLHIAGGVHATAEPQHVLDLGWDLAAIGEGESTIISLVTALREDTPLTKVPGLALRDSDGVALRTPPAPQPPLDTFPSFPNRRRHFGPIEITRGCRYTCRFCQTPFMFGGKFRHRSPASVREHVRWMAEHGLRDVRFITPTCLSYGSPGPDPDLDAVEELLATVREELPPNGRIFFGSFPSEIRPEHVTPEAMRLLKRYVANDNVIIGAQSGSDRLLTAAGRGHGTRPVRDAVRIAVEHGFRVNVDFIFGMPGETEEDLQASLRFAAELADLGARIHTHTFMPLPGTPWRDAEPAFIPLHAMRELDRLAQRGSAYGHWRRQADHAVRLAETAKAYPRRIRRRRTQG